jgi:hypothetical protein
MPFKNNIGGVTHIMGLMDRNTRIPTQHKMRKAI